MSVLDKDVVDAISKTSDGKGIGLLITDHLNWNDEKAHFSILADKINSYIGFIQDEQYLQVYPEMEKQCDYWIIQIDFLYEPSTVAKQFLDQIKKSLASIPIIVETIVVSDEERNRFESSF